MKKDAKEHAGLRSRMPCMWCGHARILLVGAAPDQPKGWKCECDACHACGPSFETEGQAISEWNRLCKTHRIGMDELKSRINKLSGMRLPERDDPLK